MHNKIDKKITQVALDNLDALEKVLHSPDEIFNKEFPNILEEIKELLNVCPKDFFIKASSSIIKDARENWEGEINKC